MISINLEKGSASLSKAQPIRIRISWPATTDYDIGAEILYKGGTTESIATFGAKGTPAKHYNRRGTVTHLGDVGRFGGIAEEIIEVLPDDEIEQIIPWVYSAQSNGTGSFYRHKVSMEVIGESQSVRIDADNASDNNRIYTCIPGMLSFGDRISIQHAEIYSEPNSEKRPAFAKTMLGGLKFTLDGPRNDYK